MCTVWICVQIQMTTKSLGWCHNDVLSNFSSEKGLVSDNMSNTWSSVVWCMKTAPSSLSPSGSPTVEGGWVRRMRKRMLKICKD